MRHHAIGRLSRMGGQDLASTDLRPRRQRQPGSKLLGSLPSGQVRSAFGNEAQCQVRSDTRAYVARRTAEGLSSKEIRRCLKRYIIRELYPLILADLADSARSI